MFVNVLLLLLISSLMAQAGNGADSCPEPFVLIGEGCYFHNPSVTRTFVEARLYCQTLLPGEIADLAVLDVYCDDFKHLASYASGVQARWRPWIGATDENHPGYLMWVDGRPVDLTEAYWDPDQPEYNDDRTCAYMALNTETVNKFRLFTTDCDVHTDTLCQLGVHART
nr:C-type lectin domain family 17, member A-like [Cherax quadricarinatus]